MTRKTGTREWSQHSVNVCRGCAHGCLYCYARANALRFGRIKSGEEWTDEQVNVVAANRDRRKYTGRVMFPTTHDITAGNAGACLAVLVNLLLAGNDVLVVSKAGLHVPALLDLARSLAGGKGKVELRVSLSCLDARIAAFWEPGAPSPADRLEAMRRTRDDGTRVSVAIEPLLEPERLDYIVRIASENCSHDGEIWIGAANRLRERTAWIPNKEYGTATLVPAAGGATVEVGTGLATVESVLALYAADPARADPLDLPLEWEICGIEAGQRPEAMRRIYKTLKINPQIRWKDSYQKVLGIDALGRKA